MVARDREAATPEKCPLPLVPWQLDARHRHGILPRWSAQQVRVLFRRRPRLAPVVHLRRRRRDRDGSPVLLSRELEIARTMGHRAPDPVASPDLEAARKTPGSGDAKPRYRFPFSGGSARHRLQTGFLPAGGILLERR